MLKGIAREGGKEENLVTLTPPTSDWSSQQTPVPDGQACHLPGEPLWERLQEEKKQVVRRVHTHVWFSDASLASECSYRLWLCIIGTCVLTERSCEVIRIHFEGPLSARFCQSHTEQHCALLITMQSIIIWACMKKVRVSVSMHIHMTLGHVQPLSLKTNRQTTAIQHQVWS